MSLTAMAEARFPFHILYGFKISYISPILLYVAISHPLPQLLPIMAGLNFGGAFNESWKQWTTRALATRYLLLPLAFATEQPLSCFFSFYYPRLGIRTATCSSFDPTIFVSVLENP